MTDVRLRDPYDLAARPAPASGQPVVGRLLVARRWIDRRDGVDTAGLVSGYRGSPPGGLEIALTRNAARRRMIAAGDDAAESGLAAGARG